MTTPSTQLGREVLAALVAGGVREVVIAPGSRNAPLSFAAYDAAAAGAVRLHTRVDERTAGFLALGLAKTGGRPTAVMCTSGTAVANLHPAVLEAAHAGLPLVVVTADRPSRLRGTNANQTTDQVRIFTFARFEDLDAGDLALATDGGSLVRRRIDRQLMGPPVPGPLHLNVQFDEPLVPTDRWTVPTTVDQPPRERLDPAPRVVGSDPSSIPVGPRTVVVAGDDSGPPARVLAERGNWPLLAEPTSGSRTGANALRCYRLLLDGGLGQQVQRAIVFGHPTLSRPVTRLLGRDDVEVWSVQPRGAWSDRPFALDRTLGQAVAELPDDPAWLDSWLEADRDISGRLDGLLAAEPGLTPHEVAGAVSAALPPEGLLFVGASSPIRDLDLMVARYAVGDRRKVIANRGLSGIDGTVSSAIGAALGRPRSSRALALMGDVTFLHDANGLVLGAYEPRPDLTIVVVNDDGGSIFAMLEQGDAAYADRYDRLFGTPHGVDLASLCAATRTPHWRVEGLAELRHALDNPNGGIEVVEVAVRRDNRRELDARIRALGS